jgi:hypothetical protein
LLTALGMVEFERAYYTCPRCRQGHSPRDRELDVEGTECSPGVCRMMSLVGSESSFEQSREQLELLAGWRVAAKAVERHAEAIGADFAAQEQAEIRRAKQLELPEVCAPAVPVFYVEMDGTGVPVVKAETEGRAGKTEGQPARKQWIAICLDQLEEGKIEALVKTLRDRHPANQEPAKDVVNQADYFERNTGRMRYPEFRARELFVGSGVIEAGCKTVIGARLKRSGMFWTVRGANTIIALRCCRLSGRFDNHWESRLRAA